MPQGSKLLIPTVLYLARDSQEQLQAGGWHKGLARRHTSRSSATLLRGGTWENLGRTWEELAPAPEPAGRATTATSQEPWSAWSSPARGGGLSPLLHRAKARGPISGRAVRGRWSTVSRAWRQLGTATLRTVRLAQIEGGCDGVNSEHRDGEVRQQSS